MTAERVAPPRFSDAIAAFLPKGSAPHDPPNSGQRARRPENTRPLALKNMDCKTIASTINFPIRNTMRDWTVPQQRGFVAARGPLQHVMRLETLARIYSMKALDYEWDGAVTGDVRDDGGDGGDQGAGGDDDGDDGRARRDARQDDARRGATRKEAARSDTDGAATTKHDADSNRRLRYHEETPTSRVR